MRSRRGGDIVRHTRQRARRVTYHYAATLAAYVGIGSLISHDDGAHRSYRALRHYYIKMRITDITGHIIGWLSYASLLRHVVTADVATL